MKINLKRLNDAVHFEGINAHGNTIHMDGSEAIGGEGKGVRPMELLLFGIASCSGIDIVSLLKKMRQNLEDIQVEVTGEREEGAVPAVFTDIHVHYKIFGDVKEDKAQKAVKMSMEQYCSVSKMIEKAAKITYSVEVNPTT